MSKEIKYVHKLSIVLKNCRGIKKLQCSFPFAQSQPNHLIYASNGSMKTSFAISLRDYSKSKGTKKGLFSEKEEQVRKILLDGSDVNPAQILVVDAEKVDDNFSVYMTNFLADKELKQSYDLIIKELDDHKKNFLKEFKKLSKSSDVEGEIRQYFAKDQSNFFDSLIEMKKLADKNVYYIAEFKFNDVFDQNGKVKEFLEKNTALLESYLQRYNELITSSSLYSKEAQFGTYQASELQKVLGDDSFFHARHKLHLADNRQIESAQELKELLDEEQKRILSDEKLKKEFEKIEKNLNKNRELRSFKDVVISKPEILSELVDYKLFAQKVLVGYFSQLTSVDSLINLYISKKEKLDAIVAKAKAQQQKWQKILNLFKSRFYVPFDMVVQNQEDAVLNSDVPVIKFYYKDPESSLTREIEAENDVLSRGEQRAFYILHLLFEIEEKKKLKCPIFIVYDDIADSFDYHNKHAITEYLADLTQMTRDGLVEIYQIILTHNFDFYRTINSRLNVNREVHTHMVKRCNGNINFYKGQYVGHFMRNMAKQIKKLGTTNEFVVFLALIPFLRNLIECRKDGEESEGYLSLTRALHMKGESPKVEDVIKIYAEFGYEIDGNGYEKESIRNLITKTASQFQKDLIGENDLPYKFVLAMSIRLEVENFVLNRINLDTEKITKNQTITLLTEFQKNCPEDYETFRELFSRVQIMTPEYIHVNTFMYEPLIDSTIDHLIDLHSECMEKFRTGRA